MNWHHYLDRERCRHFVLRLQWRAVRALAPRRTVRSRGLRFTLPCDNWITHYRWRTYNSKEPETLDWIDTWVRDGDVVFDIGANIGVYTIYAALRHPTARVVAFEPEYANLHLLRDNILANAVHDRVEVYPIALSNRIGLSRVHVQDVTPGAALHSESREEVSVTRSQRPVSCREGTCTYTIDAFCAEVALEPHCLKIDVDGGEPEVLEGAASTLRSARLRSVMIEIPGEAAARRTCERLLAGGGLHRKWRDPSGQSLNEVWVREPADQGS
jgi:FkbM family methyltransferase